MIERCIDPRCKFYGKPLVDRGWGFPVCQSTRRFCEIYPGSEDKPLREDFKDDVITEDADAPTTEG